MHQIVTNDPVFFNKVTAKQEILVVIDAGSDDVAGINLESTNALQLVENGDDAKRITIANLNTQPLLNVYLHVEILPSANLPFLKGMALNFCRVALSGHAGRWVGESR